MTVAIFRAWGAGRARARTERRERTDRVVLPLEARMYLFHSALVRIGIRLAGIVEERATSKWLRGRDSGAVAVGARPIIWGCCCGGNSAKNSVLVVVAVIEQGRCWGGNDAKTRAGVAVID